MSPRATDLEGVTISHVPTTAAVAITSTVALGLSVFDSAASAAEVDAEPSVISGPGYECEMVPVDGSLSCTITGDADGRIDLYELAESLQWAGVDAEV